MVEFVTGAVLGTAVTALLEKAKKEAEEKTGRLGAKLKQQVQEPGAGKRA